MIDSLARIRNEVQRCKKCAGLSEAIYPFGKEIGLSYIVPKIPVEIFFVAESPPSSDNFFYNKKSIKTRFRNRLFDLMTKSNLCTVDSPDQFNERGYYLADAINCKWDKKKRAGKLSMIRKNCIPYLADQIDVMKPKAIVFIGKEAKIARRTNDVSSVIHKLALPKSKIIEIPFILTVPVKTDDIVEQLRILSK